MKAWENPLSLNIEKLSSVRDLDKDPKKSLGLRRAESSELWCMELAGRKREAWKDCPEGKWGRPEGSSLWRQGRDLIS